MPFRGERIKIYLPYEQCWRVFQNSGGLIQSPRKSMGIFPSPWVGMPYENKLLYTNMQPRNTSEIKVPDFRSYAVIPKPCYLWQTVGSRRRVGLWEALSTGRRLLTRKSVAKLLLTAKLGQYCSSEKSHPQRPLSVFSLLHCLSLAWLPHQVVKTELVPLWLALASSLHPQKELITTSKKVSTANKQWSKVRQNPTYLICLSDGESSELLRTIP